jgi:competence protein ComEA
MERLRQLIRNWLGFSRTEVNGFLILLPLMILLVFSEPLYRYWLSNQPRDFSQEQKKLDSLVAIWDKKKPSSALIAKAPEKKSFKHFDPNKISVNGLKDLGFSDNLSKRIAHYREKGGVFRIKGDLLKIYGVDSTFYHQLYPYILLPDRIEKSNSGREIVSGKGYENKAVEKFDLNTADTAILKTIYGIGPSLAMRIVKFRTGLGGFVNFEQISEVYGLDSLVVKKLRDRSFIAKDFEPVRININNADEKTLSSHPYISKSVAKAIVSYRYQHGNFTDVNDLKKLFTTTPLNAEKLIPYVTVED